MSDHTEQRNTRVNLGSAEPAVSPAAGAGRTFCPVIPPVPLSDKAKILTIPCLPYVARYLERQYPNGYRLSESDALGELIYQLLRRPTVYRRFDSYQDRYSASFQVHVSQARVADRALGKVNSNLVVRLNSFLEDQIRQQMYLFVDVCSRYKIKKKAVALREFMETNGFTEEDIAYHTLWKSYMRYSKRKKK